MRTLREWRVEKMLSVNTLARLSGVTKKSIIDIEYGRRRPHYQTMADISRVLDVTPREIAEFAAVLEERTGKEAA